MKRFLITMTCLMALVGTAFGQVMQPIDQVPDLSDSSLVGAWLNKSVFGLADDISSGDNDGTATDVVWEGVGGDFDGSVDNLRITATPITAYPFTLNVWFNGDSTGGSLIVLSDISEDDVYQGLSVNSDDTVRITSRTAATLESESSVEVTIDGSWNHLVGVFTSSTDRELFLNSVSVVSDTGTCLFGAGTDTVLIGKLRDVSSTGFFDGTIKDVRIYNEAKTASWVAAEYAKGVPDDSLVLSVMDGVRDDSRYGNTLTNSGAVVGNGMEFDGSDDYIDGDSTPTIGTGDFTISLWINPDTNVTAYMSAFHNGTTNFESDIWIANNAGTLHCRLDNAQLITSGSISTDTWQQVVLIRSGTSVSAYINSSVVDTGTSSSDLSNSSGDVLIGKDVGNYRYWDGEIKDVRIYDEAKSAAWIQADYNRTRKFY